MYFYKGMIMTTVFLAQFFGIVFVVFSLGSLFNKEHTDKLVGNILNNPALQSVVGLIPLLLGVWVILIHNQWGGWQVVVTIVGWLLFLIGVFRLWCVDAWLRMVEKYAHCAPRFGGIVMLIVGLLLLYVGCIAL